MARGAWCSTVHGVTELDSTERKTLTLTVFITSFFSDVFAFNLYFVS